MNPTYDLLGMIAHVEQQIALLLKVKSKEQQQVPNQNIEDQPLIVSVEERYERNSSCSSQKTLSDNTSQVLLNQLQSNFEVIKRGINELLAYNKNDQYDQLKNNLNKKQGKNNFFVRSENTYDSNQNKEIQKNLKLDVKGTQASINSYTSQMNQLTQELKQILSSKTISDLQMKQRIQQLEQQHEELRKNFFSFRQMQESITQLLQFDTCLQDTLRQCKTKCERKY
ncbi:unnamed protein product (macronuclear) [Paramecium tetraurelia]|uniref:Syntaxin N-terminal domain-containing protein n=1 Tax=Paramecium tetraurelia TaxID=5888 RepID=A0CAA2_PARTE|nr:uncharacterized protein GSPATT00036499001 [Paramecium tetraurelia]CAK67719.1 unnamed protein product [Paramecium tetraurelia]|eukprot:XP_001435116.1 hypothetical protein (macronuclear) [Paramecium tetraurelia strain d4-2]